MIPTTRIQCLSFDEENDEYIKLTSDSPDHVSIKLVADDPWFVMMDAVAVQEVIDTLQEWQRLSIAQKDSERRKQELGS